MLNKKYGNAALFSKQRSKFGIGKSRTVDGLVTKLFECRKSILKMIYVYTHTVYVFTGKLNYVNSGTAIVSQREHGGKRGEICAENRHMLDTHIQLLFIGIDDVGYVVAEQSSVYGSDFH